MARKHLLNLQNQYGNFRISEVDCLANPRKTWENGIRMIPALKIDNTILSGIYLSHRLIEQFIIEALDNSA